MIKYILFGLWYLFIIVLSYKGMEKLKIGFSKDWGTYLQMGIVDNFAAVAGSIFWPIGWIIIGMSIASSKIIKLIEEELQEAKK